MLADDLTRYLAGEPILSRPVGSVERASLWARRHPTATALAATSLVAMIALIAAGFFIVYNGKLQRANRAIAESRGEIQAAYASEAGARRQAEVAGMSAVEQRAIAVKALEQARIALKLANSLLEGMEVTLGELKGPRETTFRLTDWPEFLDAMGEGQENAGKVAYAVEEIFEPVMREARLVRLNAAGIRDLRTRTSWGPTTEGGQVNDADAMRLFQGHLDLVLGRLVALKVRCYEFNWACARMKKDPLKFSNPKSNAWRLVFYENFQYSQDAADAGREAKALLQRVVEDYPGTSLAIQAQRELKHPFGFKWVETYVKPVVSKRSTADEAKTIPQTMHVDMSHCTRGRTDGPFPPAQ
jgi:hypothetical protein